MEVKAGLRIAYSNQQRCPEQDLNYRPLERQAVTETTIPCRSPHVTKNYFSPILLIQSKCKRNICISRSNFRKSDRATRKISTKSNPKSGSSKSRNPVSKLGLDRRSSNEKALQQTNKISHREIGFQQTGPCSSTQHPRIPPEKRTGEFNYNSSTPRASADIFSRGGI